ncbi:hypothetical protein GGI12_002043 [Dipsacomyces acuminosporus]|nr:hypothetical protein GGI12_002043 [Dipsacomyces acuminosporus]
MPALFASLGGQTRQEPAVEKPNDIVSAPISIYPEASKSLSADETEEGTRTTKKGKRVDRHKKWMEKMNAAQATKKKQNLKSGRATNKSALIRGMSGIQSSLKEIQVEQMAQDLLSLPKPTAKDSGMVSSNGSSLKSRKAKNRVAAREEKRFNQILDHPAFQANPLATIRQHLQNTLSAPATNTSTSK